MSEDLPGLQGPGREAYFSWTQGWLRDRTGISAWSRPTLLGVETEVQRG